MYIYACICMCADIYQPPINIGGLLNASRRGDSTGTLADYLMLVGGGGGFNV